MCGFITAKQQQRGMGYMALFRDAGFVQECQWVPCVNIGQDFFVAAAIGLTLDKIFTKFHPGKRDGLRVQIVQRSLGYDMPGPVFGTPKRFP